MRVHRASLIALIAAGVVSAPALAQDESRGVAGGGISVPGWTGKIDAREEAAGLTINSAKFSKTGDAMHAVTGPSVAYWQTGSRASGNYTVKATFTEPKYMNHNNHPHPYGIFIGGNDMGTNAQSYLYCMAYGTGTFIVRGFSPEPFQMNGRRGESNEAVNRATGAGQAVTQEIAMNVHGDKVECAINGKVVATYTRADVVGAGKLKSTDGVFGVRFGHNTEATVTGFSMTKH